VQGPAHASGFPLGIELVGDSQCLGVRLDHCPQHRAGAIERLDPAEVRLAERACGVPAGPHAPLKLRDRGFLELEGARCVGVIRRRKSRRERSHSAGSVFKERPAAERVPARHGRLQMGVP